MAMNGAGLAAEMQSAMGFPSVSPQLMGMATGIVDGIKTGVATFGGASPVHSISGISGSTMASLIADASGFPSVSPQLQGQATAIANHIISNGIVTYAGPPPAPPALPPGPLTWNIGGVISGLNANGMAGEMIAAMGFPSVSPQIMGMCTAIVSYVQANAQVNLGVIS